MIRLRHGVPLILAAGIALGLFVYSGASPGASTAAGIGTWTQYAHDAQRTGKDLAEQTPFSSVVHEHDVVVQGNVYAQPLVYSGRVYVATEENFVYAFDATTLAPVWSRQVAPSVPGSVVPNGCSNSNPNIGITSTPVIDAEHNRIYVVAQASPPLRYDFWTLDLDTGAPIGNPITLDPWPGATQADKAAQTALQVQRSALLLVNDYLYVSWGGRAECANSPKNPNYQGWLVAVPLNNQPGGIRSFFAPQPLGNNGGGMWSPPGPSADLGGNVYVPTGNSFATTGPANLGESVVKLSANLALEDHWTVTNWQALTAGDFDISSHTPSFLGNGVIFQSGKDGHGFLLNDANLGGGSDITRTGGELFTSPTRICTPDQRSYGVATWIPPMLFVPCVNGIKGVHVSTTPPLSFNKVWDGPTTVYPSSAMIAGGALWYIDQPDPLAGQVHGTLSALDPSTGRARFTPITLPESVAHFVAPASGNGRIYAPSVGHLSSFRMVPVSGPTATPTATPIPTSTPTTGTTTVTFNPVADSYTARSAPDSTAGGTSTFLRADLVRTDTTFLRFDLASLAGKTITAAVLRLHTNTLPWAGSNVRFNIRFVSPNDWKEAFMSFNNSVGPFAIAPTPMGTLSGPAPDQWYQSTGLTLATIQPRAGALLSMAVDAPQGDVLIVDSRESGAATAPRLVVTFR